MNGHALAELNQELPSQAGLGGVAPILPCVVQSCDLAGAPPSFHPRLRLRRYRHPGDPGRRPAQRPAQPVVGDMQRAGWDAPRKKNGARSLDSPDV